MTKYKYKISIPEQNERNLQFVQDALNDPSTYEGGWEFVQLVPVIGNWLGILLRKEIPLDDSPF
jgi:hypothetical protein